MSYIVKIEQPKAGGTVRATKADGSPLDKKFNDSTGLYGKMLDIYEKHVVESAAFADEVGFEVAHETDKVLLKVDLEKGYKVAHAYNGMGERVELLVDDKGDHYVMVERGGGRHDNSTDRRWVAYHTCRDRLATRRRHHDSVRYQVAAPAVSSLVGHKDAIAPIGQPARCAGTGNRPPYQSIPLSSYVVIRRC